MTRALFLWFQLVAGVLMVIADLFHTRASRRRRTRRDWWGLGVALALAAIAFLEIFLLAYGWIPERMLWPTLLGLDVLAILLYLGRVEPDRRATESP